MDLHLDAAAADLAVGCTYKYLNGGPGAPAFAYVAARHLRSLDQPLPGWVGHADPFSMDEVHDRPTASVACCRARRRCSPSAPSPPPSIAFDGVDLAALRAHSLALTDRAIERADRLGLEVVTPRQHEHRGSHVSLRHPDAWAVVQAAIEAGVVGDFRPPDLVRLGFAPLHLTDRGRRRGHGPPR